MRNWAPIRTARREALRKDRLGSNDFCLFCGYACLESLTQVTRRWLEANGISSERLERLLEQHHVSGKAHDPDLVVTLCLNCHREITEGLSREDVSMHPQRKKHRLVALVLRSSALLFEHLATSYRKWASILESHDEP